MPKELPDEWVKGTKKSLNVAVDLGLRGVPAGNLVIYKAPPSKNCKTLFCRWLPPEEEDTRPFKGRTNGGKGKRKFLEGTTGYEDPIQAGKAAITWCKEQRQYLQQLGIERDYQAEHSLHHYWEIYWERFLKTPNLKARARNDALNKWNGKGWGIGEQEWSHKSIDKINSADMRDYFLLLTERGQGGKAQQAQKTLIRKLFNEALEDFPLLQFPRFPEISLQKDEVENLSSEQWQKLLLYVIDMSGGYAGRHLSREEYQSVPWANKRKYSEKDWFDFYDCLMLMWFFYLRSQDMPVIRSDWFYEGFDENTRTPIAICYLQKVKSNRDKKESTHYRPEGYEFWLRLNKSRPEGYLCFPEISRQTAYSADGVKKKLNAMLQDACRMCSIFLRETITWTHIRHTALKLTLDEMPVLGRPGHIDAFAENAQTSATMLRENYLKKTSRQETASVARQTIPRGRFRTASRKPGYQEKSLTSKQLEAQEKRRQASLERHRKYVAAYKIKSPSKEKDSGKL